MGFLHYKSMKHPVTSTPDKNRFFRLTPSIRLCGTLLALASGSALYATTDISTLSPAANTTISPSYATDSVWAISSDTTLGGISWTRTNPNQDFTFNGVAGSETLTFSNSSTPTFATNSVYNGSLYWGKMTVAGTQGINVQTGFNNIILQSGLNWTATGTMTFTQPASDGNIVYAQGNGVLAGGMDLNMGSGSKGSLLVINGGTTQTVGALTGTANDYVTAYSGSGVFRNSVTPTGTNVTGSTSAATLQIGNTGGSATFAGVIGAQSGSNLAGTDTSVAAAAVNIVKLGTGTQTFTGANVYSGSTTISAGTLKLSGVGSIANSTVYSIAAGATFDTSALTTPGYSLASVATTIGVGATTNGFINVGTGALTLGNSLTVNFSAAPTASSFNLYDSASVAGDFSSVSITGTLGSGSLSLVSGTWSGTVGSYSLALNESTGILTVASAIPEPSTYAAIFGVLVLGSAVIRRRFHNN